MASKRILLASGFGPGFSASYTVPAGESGVITGWGGYNGNHVACYAALFVNSDGAAATPAIASTDGGWAAPLRVAIAAGDVVNVFASAAGMSVSVTANLTS